MKKVLVKSYPALTLEDKSEDKSELEHVCRQQQVLKEEMKKIFAMKGKKERSEMQKIISERQKRRFILTTHFQLFSDK